jgi:hypothetical protein
MVCVCSVLRAMCDMRYAMCDVQCLVEVPVVRGEWCMMWCAVVFYVCRSWGGGGTGVLPPNMCSLQPWVCGWVGLSCGLPTPPCSHPRYARVMCPRPHLHAVRDSPMYVDHGERA